MSKAKHPDDLTQIGRKLIQKWHIYDMEILREDYSATIDWGGEMSGAIQAQLERMGFEVIHEESGIYTLKYDYEI